MCGIAGFVDPSGTDPGALDARGRAMAAALAHRGPDGQGVWTDAEAGVCLAHRRLSVVDLSDAAAQPMISACGRWVVAYNGEIYNHRDLRAELPDYPFRTASDTEVLLAAVARFGVEGALDRVNGMFAFALWDRSARSLMLARDRMGIKPLYWRWAQGRLSFASEPRALKCLPGWTGGIDRESLAAFLRFVAVPAPRTIWPGVSKLEPGTLLTLRQGREPAITRWWDLGAEAAAAPRLDFSDDEATDRLEALLADAVARQMVADVPVGAFLSGGIDSSTVAALMCRAGRGRVRTFSIGFAEADYDEAPFARAVAAHLGTEHTELVARPADALEIIPHLPALWDEPFADASQIPTALVSALARRHVTVALSGDGGDELFAGYARHVAAQRWWPRLAAVPHPVRAAASGLVRAVSPPAWDAAFRLLPRHRRPAQAGERLHKFATAMAADGPGAFHRALASTWHAPPVPGVVRDHPPVFHGHPTEAMQLADMAAYLPDDILTKVDRASMGVGLEARVPLLDHRVVRFALGLPMHQRIRDGRGKWLLRRVLNRHVPAGLVERPKQGFAVPIGDWLRGPLRDWAEPMLDARRLDAEGWLDPAPIRRLWEMHLAGRASAPYPLWAVLMFQAWLERE
ncbi:MAG: asparagine synthase (glutamine-hydrolyzing) [Actinomycetota bacterium]